MKEILAALGVQTEAEALVRLLGITGFLDTLKAFAGADTHDKAFAKMRAASELVAKLAGVVGESDADAIVGKVSAWKQASSDLTATRAELANSQKAQADGKAKDLIDAAMTGDSAKLAPAHRANAEKMYTQFGIVALETYLDSLPVAGKLPTAGGPASPTTGGPAPMTPTGDAAGAATAEEKAACKALGVSLEDLRKNVAGARVSA